MLEDFVKQEKQNVELYIKLHLKEEMFVLLEKQEKDVKELDVVNGQKNVLDQNVEWLIKDVHGEENQHVLKENVHVNGQKEIHSLQENHINMFVDKKDVIVQKLFVMVENVLNIIQENSGLEKKFVNMHIKNVIL